MLTLLTALLLTGAIVVALYAFGVFNTPYLGAFRFTFYLLLALLFSFHLVWDRQLSSGRV